MASRRLLMSDLLDDMDATAGLTVFGAGAAPGAAEVRAQLVAGGVPGPPAAEHPTLRGAAAEAEAEVRLGLDRMVLCGMGGSRLEHRSMRPARA
jgi:hypothetical protein